MLDPVFFLFLLLAVAIGWLLGRFLGRRSDSTGVLQGKHFFRGLDFLLRDESDDAIEALSDAIKVDSETIEPHLALGHLCRRKGEVDRAIRIHENLLLRVNLSSSQRQDVHYELAQDYLSAGWFDRAETMLEGINVGSFARQRSVRDLLLNVYQKQHEWGHALPLLEQLLAGEMPVSRRGHLQRQAAQVCCENAQTLQAGLPSRRYLKRALQFDPNCVRASMQLAQQYSDMGRHKKALKMLVAIFKQDPRIIVDALPLLEMLHNRLKCRSKLLALLEGAYEQSPNIVLVDAIYKELLYLQRFSDAAGFLQVSAKSTAHVYHLLMAEQSDANVAVLKQLMAKGEVLAPLYRCDRCGFGLSSLHWHCPSCQNWDSIRAINPTYQGS